MVDTRVGDGIRIEACKFSSSAIIDVASGLCDPWVLSGTHITTGQYQIDLSAGTYSSEPVCGCTAINGSNTTCAIVSQSASQVIARTRDENGSTVDSEFNLNCKGKR